MEYRQVLRSQRWRRLKWRRLMIAGFACENCGWQFRGRSPRMAFRCFELHHRNYHRVGAERLDDVLLLCPRCHEALHKKAA